MTQQEFLDLIPQVLLYIVPGFFVLMIIEASVQQKKKSPMETILWSIFLSFLVEVVRNALVALYNLAKTPLSGLQSGELDTILEQKPDTAAAIALSVLLSGVIGFLLARLMGSSLGRWIVRKLNINLEPGGDYWFETLRSGKGVWVIVHMKNGMVYRGQLSTYTADPNEPVKMLTLTQFQSKVKLEEPKGDPDAIPKEKLEEVLERMIETGRIPPPADDHPAPKKRYYRTVRDETGKPDAKVLIKLEDILTIEFGA